MFFSHSCQRHMHRSTVILISESINQSTKQVAYGEHILTSLTLSKIKLKLKCADNESVKCIIFNYNVFLTCFV